MPLESKIQKKIIDYLTKDSFFVLNLIKTNKSWIPDLLAIKNWVVLWIEVKQINWKLSKIQEYRIRELKDKVLVVYWYDDFIIKFNLTYN